MLGPNIARIGIRNIIYFPYFSKKGLIHSSGLYTEGFGVYGKFDNR